jgi:hypothetical protein
MEAQAIAKVNPFSRATELFEAMTAESSARRPRG